MAFNLSSLAGAGAQFFDNNGVILSGGKLYSYAAGTTTPETTYTTNAGNVAHTNPIVLNSAGRVATGEIWLTAGENYKFSLFTSADVLIATYDNITGINGTGITSNASTVVYDPAGTGAVATTVQTKLRETVSVKDFGAVGDGIANDTTAINNALLSVNALGKVALYFPAGIYRYSGGGWLGNGVVITGAGRDATTIRSITASPTDGYLFECRGYGSGIRSMRFDALGTTQTGGSYVWLSAPESFIEDFHITNDFNGILMTGNVSRIRHGRFQDGATNAIRIRAEGGDNSQLIDDVLMGAQLPQVSFAGIRVRNSSALIISNTSVIQQGHNLLIDPTTAATSLNTADGNVFSLYANNCFFDNASGNGIRITPTGTGSVVRCRFANCWAGSSASDGIYIDNAGSGIVQGMYFDSCHAVLNGTGGSGSGFTTGGLVADVSINGGLIANNTQGVFFNTGTTNSKISGATIGVGGGLLGNSGNGVVLSSGTNGILVTGNIIRANTDNGVVMASGTNNNTVTGNTVQSNTENGIFLQTGTSNITVTSNIVNDNALGGIAAEGTSSAYVIADNFIFGNGTNLTVTPTISRVVRNNTGVTSPDITSDNSFVATGDTSVVVAHNLGVTPDSSLILISPTSGWGDNPLFVDTTSITSTQFTVRSAVAVANNYTFAWTAKINNN
jgi:parallel beta-helix repeat protein